VKPFTVAPRARRDLQGAWIYSRDHWGLRHANSYVRDLSAIIQWIADNPMLGQACDDVRPGYRRHPAGSHVLFYEIRDNDVVIIRVLHQQMNVEDKF
jgi:toxin ParE1/3/4